MPASLIRRLGLGVVLDRQSSRVFNWPSAHIGLGLILAVGAGLRFWGLDFGLPNINCRPDETILVDRALAIGAGDLNPHFFNYPTFHFYLLTLLYGLYFLLGYTVGVFAGLENFQYHYLIEPANFYLIGRAFSALLGTLSIGLVYAIGRRLDGVRVGLLAAVFLAGSLLHVRDSHFLTVDIAATFHILAAYAFALRYRDHIQRRDLLLAGLFAGLALSTKYNMALLVPSLALAIVLVPNRAAGPKRLDLLLFAGVAGGAFFAGSPYILFDFPAFWRDINFERLHAVQGHGVDLGRGWWHHLHFSLPLGLGWPLFAGGLLGVTLWASRSRPAEWALLAGVLVYYGVAGSSHTVFVRYMLPVVPLLCLAAATLLGRLTRGRSALLTVLCAGILVAPSAYAAYQHNRLLSRVDSRVLASRWIEEHIPSGSRVALLGDNVGHPNIARTRAWLQRQWEDRRAVGGGKWLGWALSWDEFPPVPNYDVVELRARNPSSLRSIWTAYDIDTLRRHQVHWVITHQHPLAYSHIDSAFASQLQREGELAWGSNPFQGPQDVPVYDPIDAYYVPLAGYEAVSRPGPSMHIYHLPEQNEGISSATTGSR